MVENNKKKKLAMVVFSGDLDKLMAAFIIATGAAASNIEVTMFFTFWGLRALKKRTLTGKSFMGRMMGIMQLEAIIKASQTSPRSWTTSLSICVAMVKAKKAAT